MPWQEFNGQFVLDWIGRPDVLEFKNRSKEVKTRKISDYPVLCLVFN